DMSSSALYKADLTGLITDESTKNFHMRCPEKGAFIGWKVCDGRKVVMLLVPEDAQRVQGTRREIRVDKAKVLTIKSPDYKTVYTEAHAYVDENFIYKKGEMVYAVGFDPDRFTDSAGGIHIWMNREEAVAYLG
ncbi:MAG: pentapeptide repeat-containing protein, partial [Clostridia bacterium]|nr:pentapeptide repeat-containing protein [Clostridia bacterium]